jgi:hypothetical protein
MQNFKTKIFRPKWSFVESIPGRRFTDEDDEDEHAVKHVEAVEETEKDLGPIL